MPKHVLQPNQISGGEVADVMYHFPNHNPPPIQVWIKDIFPVDPPNQDWSLLRGSPPTVFREDVLGVDSDRRALLFKTYNYEAIRKAYIISKQCSAISPDTGKVVDSQLKALSDNFLMDAYLHYNFSPIQIVELKNGQHEADSFIQGLRKNLATASNSDVPLCQNTESGLTEIEELSNARRQTLAYANDLSRLQGMLSQMQERMTAMEQEKIETKQAYEIVIMQKNNQIEKVDEIKNAAIDQATRDVAALVAEKTMDLQNQNDKLFSELKETHDALLASREELGREYAQRVAEAQRVERALCAQKVAETERELGAKLSDSKITHEQFKSKTKSAIESSMKDYDDKLKKYSLEIAEKDLQISNIKNALKDLVSKTDIQSKSIQGMNDLLLLARRDIQTKDQIIAELKSSLQQISLNAEAKVQQLLASKISTMDAQHALELNARNNKIIDLEKQLADKSGRDCVLYTEKINKHQDTISSIEQNNSELRQLIQDKDASISQLTKTLEQLKQYVQYRDKSENQYMPS